MRLVITGSNGQLGYELLRGLGWANDALAIDLPDYDIADPGIADTIARFEPEVVIHAAAMTNVDSCERSPDDAYRANGEGTRNVALGCKRSGAKMVYISTNYVFSGNEEQAYTEHDTPNPISVYGRSKLAGEWYVQDLLEHYLIARTAWLYSNRGRNFLSTMLSLGEQSRQLEVVHDQFGSPTWARDLAKGVMSLLNGAPSGIYHLTNSGFCSWYDWARAIFELAGMKVPVRPIAAKDYERAASPPRNGVMSNVNAARLGVSLRPWQEALDECIAERVPAEKA